MSGEGKMAYSPKEAALALGISERTMRSAIADKRVRVVKFGARLLVPREELEALLRDETKQPVAV